MEKSEIKENNINLVKSSIDKLSLILKKMKNSFIGLSLKTKLAYILSISVACILLIIFFTYINLTTEHKTRAKAISTQSHSKKTLTKKSIKNDNVKSNYEVVSNAILQLNRNQEHILQSINILIDKLNSVEEKVNDKSWLSNFKLINDSINNISDFNKSTSSNINLLNDQMKNLSKKVTTLSQVVSTHSSPNITLIDNPGFKLTSIMWLNGQPKAVVYDDKTMADQMMAVGDNIGQWTLVGIKDNCTDFSSAKGQNKQCI